jgi:hypothetical protein
MPHDPLRLEEALNLSAIQLICHPLIPELPCTSTHEAIPKLIWSVEQSEFSQCGTVLEGSKLSDELLEIN